MTPPVTLGRSLPNFALSASTAWPAVEGGSAAAAGGAATVGAAGAVIGGARIEGGKFGAAPGPDGGARLTAPPPTPSGSGTEAGGTGGGRSPKICAEADVENDKDARTAS